MENGYRRTRLEKLEFFKSGKCKDMLVAVVLRDFPLRVMQVLGF